MRPRSVGLIAFALLTVAAPAVDAAPTPPHGAYLPYALDAYRVTTSPVAGDPAHRANVSARFLFPAAYGTPSSRHGALAFRVPGRSGSPSCRFTVTFTVRVHASAAGAAAEHVAGDLPAEAPYLLATGQRDRGAFRVVRRPRTAEGRIRLSAELALPAAHEPAAAPAPGQDYWAEVRADATTAPGATCHVGTYRSVLGPQLADAMATARVTFASVGAP
jgi:hypothetical protein